MKAAKRIRSGLGPGVVQIYGHGQIPMGPQMVCLVSDERLIDFPGMPARLVKRFVQGMSGRDGTALGRFRDQVHVDKAADGQIHRPAYSGKTSGRIQAQYQLVRINAGLHGSDNRNHGALNQVV